MNFFQILKNFEFSFLILEFWNFLENFEILWNFMKTKIFEIFW
jgi:hypothetical protein